MHLYTCSDCVCMNCATYTGFSSELWRFNTTTRGWEHVTAFNGAGPRGRSNHVMTSVTNSVGVDLWLHGGRTRIVAGRDDTTGDLWRFDTSTRGWEFVHDTPNINNGPVPTGRYGHVMTSVGQDLWLHGGESSIQQGEGNSCSSPAALLILVKE